ncbi:MAG: DNA mismatch repair protein MutS [Desulfamplus sp.]|nr:DNA mismatch repair protein MutS [Desulfamplus sp.]
MTILKTTPMMEQYFSIKDRYPDAILFYRMGDFYEMFHGDALKASAILEIALTSRNKQQDDPIPMCGIPHRAANAYIAKLIENGCKVAVCEQVEDASVAQGLVRREVVRVITPGMILNEDLLDRSSNNYLLALSVIDGDAGMAWLDISTGIFRTTQTQTVNGKIPDMLIDDVLRVAPSEILLPANFKTDPAYSYIRKCFSNKSVSYLEKIHFKLPDAKLRLMDKFSTRSLKGFGCEQMPASISAAGAIISYVQETQLQDTDHITNLQSYSLDSFLVIDDRSCRNLELLKNIETGEKRGSLLHLLDKTVTAMGARLLRSWLRYPLNEKKAIEKRLDAVEEALKQKPIRSKLRTALKSVYDLERLGSKISMGQGNARDLVFLKNSLLNLPDIINELDKFKSELFKGDLHLKSDANARESADTRERTDTRENADNTIVSSVPMMQGITEELMKIANLIELSIREDAPMVLNEGQIIKNGFNSELDELIELSENGKAWIIKEGLKEKEKTGLSSLKIKFNKVFGYFIEVSKAQAASVPDNYIRKQTLVNAERFITEELKQVESKVLNAEDKRAVLEYEIFSNIRRKIVEKTAAILKMANFLATVDVLLCFAENADLNNYTRPEINDRQIISITDGRHPVVEKMIAGERYVPNSISLNNETSQMIIITGPNMAGKSTVLRQVALQVLMAQTGSFVPAAKADIAITDRIFTRVGALDNLSQGQSTFMVEMEETANILNNATENSLVILDEIGRGTSTFDGLSIAWAVAEYLHDLNGKGVKTLFATHYHELINLEKTKSRVKNYNIAVKEFNDHIIFLRRLVEGGTNKSYGIQVARLAGVPAKVILRAKDILTKIELRGYREEQINIVSETENSLYEHKKQSSKSKNTRNSVHKLNRENISGQLELFDDNKVHEVIKSIETLDITTMTPVDALVFLNNIHGMINRTNQGSIKRPCPDGHNEK